MVTAHGGPRDLAVALLEKHMTKTRTTFKCPTCGADVTVRVYQRCKEEGDVVRLAGVGKHANDVTVECPNGHWAEYLCPSDARD